MRIGILTSWLVPCGIAQYSARFADALVGLGHEPVILAGVGDANHTLPEVTSHEVRVVASIGNWRNDRLYHIDPQLVKDAACDVVHVQYQSGLFRQPHLAALRDQFAGPMAITYHDNCIRHDFPGRIFDRAFTHRDKVGMPGAEVLAMPIEVRKPIVCTFGLGRSRADLIREACGRNGWVFDDWSSHGVSGMWVDHEVLMDRLRSSDAIVLWYEDHDMAGASSAARQAMSARRPLFTNDTTWFADLPESVDGWIYTKVHSMPQLEANLSVLFGPDPYVLERSWTAVADRIVSSYPVAAR